MFSQDELKEQMLGVRAQLAALTALLKETPAGDGDFILSPARHATLDKLFEHHLNDLRQGPGVSLG
jgi:hypothetical protein